MRIAGPRDTIRFLVPDTAWVHGELASACEVAQPGQGGGHLRLRSSGPLDFRCVSPLLWC